MECRWHNHLNPALVKREWTVVEEQRIFEQHKLHGNRWATIAEAFPGRTDNSVKNYFYSTLRRSLRRMGKVLGIKNSTGKMRSVKPATLSSIFNIAEGNSIPNSRLIDSRLDFKELAEQILHFSTWKPKLANSAPTPEDVDKFNAVLSSMEQIKYPCLNPAQCTFNLSEATTETQTRIEMKMWIWMEI